MRPFLLDQLTECLNQTITVYTTSGSPQNKISGILIGIQEDYITLVLKVGERQKTGPIPINFKKIIPTHSNTLFVPGIIAEVPIQNISHILRYAL